MSLAAAPESFTANHFAGAPITLITPDQHATAVRRRASIEQGRALEILGHAVEYLVDSRLFLMEGVHQPDEQQALQILMRLSRAVFSECPEAVSMGQRVNRWMIRHFAKDPHEKQHKLG